MGDDTNATNIWDMWTTSTSPPFDCDSIISKDNDCSNENESAGVFIITLFFVVGSGVLFSLVREYLKNVRRGEARASATPAGSPPPQDNDLIQSMTPAQRMEFVLNVLNTQQFKATEQDILADKVGDDDTSSSSSGTSIDDHDEEQALPENDDVRTCAICLEAFNATDTVCTSSNEECNHVFHRDCALEWLLKNEDCPCCRRPYLTAAYVVEV